MDENHSIVTTDNEITVAELNPEPIGQPTDLIFEDSSLTDKLINPSAQLIIETFYEKMLGPATIEDLSNGQLLQPMLMQNEMHTESTGKVTSCLDEPRIDQLLPSDLSYDDDPNTLLQPLEMHQLPRNDDDDSADEEDDDKDESDEEDEDMDEDVDMVGSIDGELDKSTEEQSGVTKIEKEYVIDKASVIKEQEFRCALCKMTFSGKTKHNVLNNSVITIYFFFRRNHSRSAYANATLSTNSSADRNAKSTWPTTEHDY